MQKDEQKERMKKESKKKRHGEDDITENQILAWRSYKRDGQDNGEHTWPPVSANCSVKSLP